MITIRIPKQQWARAWRAMIEIAPVRLVARDPIYEVLPAHLELLDKRGVSYEVVRAGPAQREPHSPRLGSGRSPRRHAAASQSGRHAAAG
jgi:hypothetical protein